VGVAESAPQAYTRSICVIRITVELHFNWYRASRGSLGDSWASCWHEGYHGGQPLCIKLESGFAHGKADLYRWWMPGIFSFVTYLQFKIQVCFQPRSAIL